MIVLADRMPLEESKNPYMSKSTIVKFALAISFFPAVAGFVFQISEEADIKPLLLWFRISILVSLILGFIILLGLIFAERYLSAHRSQLGTLFTGGLYGVTFGALILVVCNSILILLSIWLFLETTCGLFRQLSWCTQSLVSSESL